MCTYLYSYQVKINVTVCCVGNGNFFVVGFWMDFFYGFIGFYSMGWDEIIFGDNDPVTEG